MPNATPPRVKLTGPSLAIAVIERVPETRRFKFWRGTGLRPAEWREYSTRTESSNYTRSAELDQIQFRLGHVSIRTTEQYLECKQRFRDAVNDHVGWAPDAPLGTELRANPTSRPTSGY